MISRIAYINSCHHIDSTIEGQVMSTMQGTYSKHMENIK